ncbi:hypothetical protein JOC78_002382 [Bacillus ectoiniformans]|uniref:DUF4247 domain-containing protein n=1 Tax=Bacillus ectoiniformans TaxID=1494429 RepID=UPI00195A8698|nr:DUF4247 domain-containing protein [Bacillus ectoiniformans]MBM7649429.1 hypothetical protein [Bacillus ectoiniformans]
MEKRILFLFILLVSALGLLAGCGFTSAEEHIVENYPLIDAVESQVNSEDRSLIYQAENRKVEELADELIQVEEPDQTGKYTEGKQVLIYDDQFIILSEDPETPDHSLIEISDEEFVRDNYRPGFFTGMLLGQFLSNSFGSSWDKNARCRQYNNDDCYNGYGSSGGYYGGSSGRGSTFRGGGPGTGK